tara:strand:+ start:725 stop:1468 length:744 start_codon:yes stop_codon:yes gene_type:complete
MNLRSSFKIFVESYPKEKSASNYSNIWRWLIINPISIILAYLFSLIKIQPNLITLISLIIGLISCYKFFLGEFLLGSCLINFSYLLDCVDGHLARYSKKTSKRGKYFDDVVGIVVWSFSWIFIGFGLYNSDNSSLIYFTDHFSFLKDYHFILLGVLAGYFSEMRTLISYKFNENIDFKSQSKSHLNRKNKNLFYYFMKNIISVGGFVMPFFIIFSYLEVMDIFVLIYSIIYTLIFIYYSFSYYYKLT